MGTIIIPAILSQPFFTAEVFASCRIPVIGCLLLLLFLLRRRENAALFLMIAILSFHMFSLSVIESSPSFMAEREDIVAVGGTVVTEPGAKTNRRNGFNLSLSYTVGREGEVLSAKGTIYVISDFPFLTRGDEAELTGYFSNNSFIAKGAILKRTGVLQRGRKKILSIVRGAFPVGNSGNTASLLLTGSTLDGNADIQDAMRKGGLSYLFSLSGMHLSLLSMVLLPLLGKVAGKKGGAALTSIVLALFTHMAGMRPSLVRALSFFILRFFLPLEYAFSLSLPMVLFILPMSASDISLTLSFASLSGILLFSPSVTDFLSCLVPLPLSILSLSAASISALVFSVPLTQSVFGSWTFLPIVLGIPGAVVTEFIFFMSIILIFIPNTECIFDYLMQLFGYLDRIPESWHFSSLSFYYPLLAAVSSIFLLHRLPSILSKKKSSVVDYRHVESLLRQRQ